MDTKHIKEKAEIHRSKKAAQEASRLMSGSYNSLIVLVRYLDQHMMDPELGSIHGDDQMEFKPTDIGTAIITNIAEGVGLKKSDYTVGILSIAKVTKLVTMAKYILNIFSIEGMEEQILTTK
jgi:hypothetical protein